MAEAPRGRCVAWDLDQGLPPFDGELYGVITASGILEYIADVPRLLQAARSRLKPGGQLLVAYFNMRHTSRRGGDAFRHEHWKNDWSAAEFRTVLEQAGFHIDTTSFSTRGSVSAPDVRGEAAVLAAEAQQDWSVFRLDDIAHTLICTCTLSATAATEAPSVSVLLPAWNRLDLLATVLQGLIPQAQQQAAELIVVDDGSEPPVASLLAALGNPSCVTLLRHEKNAGRGAALNTGFAHAKGSVVIVCDSDSAPEPDFIADHLEFHRTHPELRATACGALAWGVDAGPFGRLLGARSNPRMENRSGPLPWTLWYTDNWSFKRAGFNADEMRFDLRYRAWGFEDLELGRRLAMGGASNTLLSTALGRHLKPASFEALRSCFRRSVPNMLLLASDAPSEWCVKDWIACGTMPAKALAAAEHFVEAHWHRLESLSSEHGDFEALLPTGLRELLATAVSDSVFRVGVAHGFAQLEPLRGAVEGDGRAGLLDLAPLSTACVLAGTLLGEEEASWEWMRAQVHALQREAGLLWISNCSSLSASLATLRLLMRPAPPFDKSSRFF